MNPPWHRVEVDGETYYWRTYASTSGSGEGPLKPIEMLHVSRAPDQPGVGGVYPAGTSVTEQHAVDLVRLFKKDGRVIPG